MSIIFKCDNCKNVFEDGFNSQFQNVQVKKKKEFTVEINIRPPHLCWKCFGTIVREAIKGQKAINEK